LCAHSVIKVDILKNIAKEPYMGASGGSKAKPLNNLNEKFIDKNNQTWY
jgi:hypothetical protein